MHGNTPHIVISIEDCLAVGGHFYSSKSFASTLCGLVVIHYFGRMTTNDDHSDCRSILFRLLFSYLRIARCINASVSKGKWELFEENGKLHIFIPYLFLSCCFSGIPNLKELASLLIAVIYMPDLTPNASENPWQSTPQFRHDYELAEKYATELAVILEDVQSWKSILQQVELEFLTRCVEIQKGKHWGSLVISRDFSSSTPTPNLDGDNDAENGETELESEVEIESGVN